MSVQWQLAVYLSINLFFKICIYHVLLFITIIYALCLRHVQHLAIMYYHHCLAFEHFCAFLGAILINRNITPCLFPSSLWIFPLGVTRKSKNKNRNESRFHDQLFFGYVLGVNKGAKYKNSLDLLKVLCSVVSSNWCTCYRQYSRVEFRNKVGSSQYKPLHILIQFLWTFAKKICHIKK